MLRSVALLGLLALGGKGGARLQVTEPALSLRGPAAQDFRWDDEGLVVSDGPLEFLYSEDAWRTGRSGMPERASFAGRGVREVEASLR